MYLLGHGFRSQCISSSGLPVQLSPPRWGAGLVQLLLSVIVPWPQVFEHVVYALQVDHLPCTKRLKHYIFIDYHRKRKLLRYLILLSSSIFVWNMLSNFSTIRNQNELNDTFFKFLRKTIDSRTFIITISAVIVSPLCIYVLKV